jgi:hypothetical protein
MKRITIQKTLRPLKLAFLVKPRDRAAVLRSIQYNTALWGGIYNPIFVVRRHNREALREKLDLFDPDFIVRMSDSINIDIDYPDEHILEEPDFVLSDQGSKHFHYGCGVEGIFDYLWNDWFAFERRYKQTFYLPVPKNRLLSLFQAAWFGQYPERFGRDYSKSYKRVFEAEEFTLSRQTVGQFPFGDSVTPFHIGQFGIDVIGNNWRGSYIFLLDGVQIDDILEFWNFRAALGGNIFPVPLQWQAELLPALRQFVDHAYRPLPYNSRIYEGTTAVKSSNLEEKLLRDFVAKIDVPKPDDSQLPPLMYSKELPDIGVQRSSMAAGLSPIQVKGDDEWDEVFVEGDGSYSFKTLAPVFKDFVNVFGKSYWVNELEISAARLSDEKLAGIIPKGKLIEEAMRRQHPCFNDTRISRKGIVAFCDHLVNSRLSWKLISGDVIAQAWISQYGLESRINEKGAICYKIIEMMGNLFECWPLRVNAVRKVLKKLESGHYLPGDEIESEIKKEVAKDRREVYKTLFNRLVSLSVLIPGLAFKCEHCLTWSWYSLEDIGQFLRCPRCLSQSKIPALHKKNRWQYRSNGVLGIEKSSQGGIGTILALKFFLQDIGGFGSENTFLPNFEVYDGQEELGEVDFVLLRRGSAFYDKEVSAVIGECKTNFPFSEKDTRSMKQITERIPGCFIAFTTLNDELTLEEKCLIRELAEWGREYIGDGQRLHPVLVFTGIEILGDQRFPLCWKSGKSWVAQKAKDLGYSRRSPSTLLEIAEATQQIHLDMPPFYELS